jgi:hypothetical protein
MIPNFLGSFNLAVATESGYFNLVDGISPSAILGLNHAVSAALHQSKATDPPEILECLVEAAKVLKRLHEQEPFAGLDVDFWIGESGEQIWN